MTTTLTERNATAGITVLRLFLGQFWLLQMIGKARDQESGITSVHNLSIWAKNVTAWMAKTTPLPEWAIRPYTTGLPYVECLLGIALLLGLFTRQALIASALVVISLDVGLMFQLKHDVVLMNTIIIFASLLGLGWEPWNRWSLDQLLRRRG
jgi:uncharacterized membrane protein YphA (DoxX/SURF4 family)